MGIKGASLYAKHKALLAIKVTLAVIAQNNTNYGERVIKNIMLLMFNNKPSIALPSET